MGAYLSSPQTEKETDRYNDTHFRVGSSSMQGWRQAQEDAHRIILNFGKYHKGKQKQSSLPDCAGLFTVMDGHGGGQVSAYAATQLEDSYSGVAVDENSSDKVYQSIIMGLDKNIRDHFTKLASNSNSDDDSAMQQMLDQELNEAKSTGMTKEKATQLMMKVLYLQQKSKNNDNISDSMGCTCVTSLIIPRKVNGELLYHVKATNSGDSRVLVWRQETNEVFGTTDHKPNDPQEKARIEAAGGEVREMTAGGDRVQYRVNGNLNLCRALGDFEYKKSDNLPAEKQMITSCPDVYSWTCKEGDIVVLACDGIFDVKTNKEVIQFVRDRIEKKDLGTICEECMTDCLADDPKITHGIGGDNMTIVVIHLVGTDSKSGKKWPPNRARKQEEEEEVEAKMDTDT